MKVVYNQHIFAHYRQVIIDRMVDNPEHDFYLVGDTEDPHGSGIRGAIIGRTDKLVRLSTKIYRGGVVVQPGLGHTIRQLHPDCVIFCGDPHFASVWLQAIVLRFQGKRVLFWTHGWLSHPHGLIGIIRRQFYRIANGLLLYGNRAKAIGVHNGFAPENLYVIYNSLDYSHQSAIRAQISSAELVQMRMELFGEAINPVVMCCARLTANRGLDLLLKSLYLLQEQGHVVDCVLVGAGPEREKLMHYAQEHQLRVKFYGSCYDERTLARLFMMSNVCVSPGWVGLTAIHSLTYGTPVITHDNLDEQGPECEAIIDGATGALFRQHDVNDLTEKIRTWTTSEVVEPQVRERCYQVIAQYYNADYQMELLKQALAGVPANDTTWKQWMNRI